MQIARDWNAKEDPFTGFVLQCEIPNDYAVQFEQRTVGGPQHRELWVPSELQ